MSSPTAVRGPQKPLAIVAVIAGGVLGLALASGMVSLLRERLHHQCSGGAPGTEAEGWICADGIGYLFGVVGPAGLSLIAVVAALLLLRVQRDTGLVRQGLAVGAIVVVTLGVGSTWLAAADPRPVPPGESRAGYWMEAVLPAAIVLFLALVLALAGLRRGLPGRMLTLAAAAGILIATVLQLGLAVATVPALGLVLASAAMSDVRPDG